MAATPAWVAPGRGGGWLPHGFHLAAHSHTEGQLVYTATGSVATVTERGTWVAASDRVTWTPPGFEHSHRFYGPTDVRVIPVEPHQGAELAPFPGVFAVSPLLREVLLTLSERPGRAEVAGRLLAVAIDEVGVAPQRSVQLPEPYDDRLRAVAGLLHEDPSRTTTLAELGRSVGASERSLSRLFHTELGLSFHRWRTILRIHHGLAHLADGRSVTDTAVLCGWSNPSSFIEAFTEIIGQTPGRYQAGLRVDRP